MKEIILVGFGGCIGSILRYKTGTLILWLSASGWLSLGRFPWATFTVNMAGCFLVGLFAVLIERSTVSNAEARIFLITGFLGGFTTFSAFGLETLSLIRSGAPALAALNAVGSVALGVIAVWLGMRVGS